MVDLSAGSKETTIDVGLASQSVEAVGELAHEAFSVLQLDIVSLAVGHGTR